MKVLMTGMSSSHCSIGKNVSFFSTLHEIISEFAEVTICDPKLSWTRADLQNYDAVIVGIVPPTALSANKIYGALHVLDLMYESPKLRLVVDSPQVWQFNNSLGSFKRNPTQIFNELYANRKNYDLAKSTKYDTASSLADKMVNLPWPKTYVPTLPWKTSADLAASLRFVSEGRLVPLSIDSYLLTPATSGSAVRTGWAVDNVKSKWWTKLADTLRDGARPLVSTTRPDDALALSTMESSLGAVIAPQDRIASTWWSYRYIQALNSSTPIATYWQDCQEFDPSWAKLAYQIEDMHPYERAQVAADQYRIYSASIPTKPQIKDFIENDLKNSTKEKI
jgi:hypothetical protein